MFTRACSHNLHRTLLCCAIMQTYYPELLFPTKERKERSAKSAKFKPQKQRGKMNQVRLALHMHVLTRRVLACPCWKRLSVLQVQLASHTHTC